MLWILPLLLVLSETASSKEAPTELSQAFWGASRSETLPTDFLEQRKLGWNLWTEVLRPAGRFLVWQTWYSREDLQRIFQHLYEGLGILGRRQRQSLSMDSIQAALDWNASATLQAIPGMQKIVFNRSALIHILQNYQQLEKCQKKKPDCVALQWPESAVFIKSSWRRSEDGFHVDRFASDAESLALQWQKSQWTADSSFDPSDEATFALRLPTGQKFHLVGLHASVRTHAAWYWTSLWLDPDAPREEGQTVPWSWRLCSIAGWSQPLRTQVIAEGWPVAAAAQAHLQKNETLVNWCSNPYLEAGVNNHKTNCIGCHQHAGRSWNQQEFKRRLTQDLSSLQEPVAEPGPADFVWSVFAGPEALVLPMMDSIEYFDVYDPYQ